ncbi:Hypothetical predicted protein, partial [Paramuricea clavata]
YHNDYTTWKQEIELLTKVTGLGKAKQGIAVCLTLDGKAKEVGLELGNDLGGEDGLGQLLRKLDTLFLKATTESDYEAYKNFDTVRKKPSTNSASGVTGDEAISVKQEAMYSASNRTQVRTSLIKYRSNRKTNPLNRFGQPTRCRICQSIFHYATNCPEKSERVHLSEDVPPSEEGVESVNITLLPQSEILIAESYGTAILDTACTKTVCGKSWLQNFVEKDGKVLSTQKSHRPFKFGHESLIYSDKVVTIAAKIGKTNCKIKVEVVPIELPLLCLTQSTKKRLRNWYIVCINKC